MSRFGSASAFVQALEARFKRLEGLVTEKRQVLAIQRFLARVLAVRPDVILKGGMGLKLRNPAARATKDLDLRCDGDREANTRMLQEAARLALDEDFMTFSVVFSKPLENVAGHRFRAECQIAARPFSVFDVDVVGPEPLVGEIDLVVGASWLDFAGVPTPSFRVYPIASQIAEKVHALTLPRSGMNTRVKDLPDIALLASLDSAVLESRTLRSALETTFAHRRTHSLPLALPAPPAEWQGAYAEICRVNGLRWRSLADLTSAVFAFINPVLASTAEGTWSLETWVWR